MCYKYAPLVVFLATIGIISFDTEQYLIHFLSCIYRSVNREQLGEDICQKTSQELQNGRNRIMAVVMFFVHGCVVIRMDLCSIELSKVDRLEA